jgi:lipid-binding SYLF domain-containing protein
MKRRRFTSLSAVALTMAITGCSTTSGSKTDAASKRQEIDAGVSAALNKLYASVKGSRELAGKAQGILVFPNVLAAGLVIGGEYGEGSLQAAGSTAGYYSTATGSFGLQIGAQSKAVIFMFMTKDAFDKFRASKGWTAGVDANVALAKMGADGSIDTSSISAPVLGFVLNNAGLMANLSLQGTKVSKLDI